MAEGVPAKRVVSPLQRLLMGVSTDSLLSFLHRSELQYSLTRKKNGEYRAVIFADGVSRYHGAGTSAKVAFANALSLFLIQEQRDHHDYGWKHVGTIKVWTAGWGVAGGDSVPLIEQWRQC